MSENASIVPFTLDDYFQSTPIGSIERAVGNNLYGINHRQTPGMVPINKDSYGLTFFVRPQLNLQSDNVRNFRLFYSLLTSNDKSVQRFARCMLDPRLSRGYPGSDNSSQVLDSPFVDTLNPFISVLTNNLNSISGWPDVVSNAFTSKAGIYREEYSMVDDIVKNFSAFDISATFRNTRGDPIIFLFYIWMWYQSLVFEGLLVPYPDFIVENEIDYNTRIYRLVLDAEKRYVKKIAACGAAFPISIPMGEFFDFSNEKPFNDQTKDFTIRFRCMGAIYQDDILIKEFNDTVTIFNVYMLDEYREKYLVKVHPSLLTYFNHRGYPRINPSNYELEWWIPGELWNARTAVLLNNNAINPIAKDNNEAEA